jgi:class 3 adenylate cyclase/Flp pilus assembly protein TadD
MPIPGEQGTRKLAAIMFTDMKGFSRKMQENELAAFEILRNHDSILQQVIQKHGGRIIKSVGDAFMVDFSSAVNAVKCAVEAQETFWAYNKDKSDFERIEIRIGIHLGDVIDVGNDMYGDGVNIASRIESITEPNRICISQDIYNQIKNKLLLKAARIGQVELKNIAEPVEVYELLIDSIPELSTPSKKVLEADTMRAAELSSRQEAEEAHRIEEMRRKKDQEIAAKTEQHYQRAVQLFDQGNIDEAEREIEEIFRLTPIHGGAQSLQLKIDAFRFQQEEDRKLRQAQEARKAAEEREKTIQEVIAAAGELLNEKRFEEALTLLREALSLDANHPGALAMESRIRQAATESVAPPPSPVAVEQAPVQQQVVVRRAALGLKQRAERAIPWGRIAAVSILLIVAAVGYVFFPTLKNIVFPTRVSLVILESSSDSADEDRQAGRAIAALLAELCAGEKNLMLIAPSSTAHIPVPLQTPAQIRREFPVDFALLLNYKTGGGRQQLRARLLNLPSAEQVWSSSTDLEPTHLGEILFALREKTLHKMSLTTAAAPPPLPLPKSPHTLRLFLDAVGYLNQQNQTELMQAIALFDSLQLEEPSFVRASAYKAYAYLRLFETTGENEKQYASLGLQHAQAAQKHNPSDPLASAVIGAVLRHNQKFDDAESYITAALDVQPSNSFALRQKALIALARGKFPNALEYARKALTGDPKNSSSHLVAGIIHHFMRDFESALQQYDAAIALGGNSATITNRYRLSAWIAKGQIDRVVQYGMTLIQNDREDFRPYYWVGRALQLGGRAFESQAHLGNGIQVALKRIETAPNDWNAYSYLALLYGRSGRFPDAEQALSRALELNPRAAQVLYRKAALLAIQDNKQESFAWLKKAVQTEFIPAEILSPDFLLYGTDRAFPKAITVAH